MEPATTTIPLNSIPLMEQNAVSQNFHNANTLTNIFCFLDFQAQCCASLVCKNWRQIISKTDCTYGEIFSLLAVAQVQPKSCTLFTSASTGEFHVHGTIGEFTLISQEPHNFLFLIDEKGKQIPINLRDALNPQEKNHDVLKVQRLKSAIILSDQHFVTVTEKGTIAMWKLSNQVVKCVEHLQIFNSEELQGIKIYSTYHFNDVKKAFVVRNKLIIKKMNYKIKHIPIFDVFDLDIKGKIVLDPEGIPFFSTRNLGLSLIANNSEKIFHIGFNQEGSYVDVFYLRCENIWDEKRINLKEFITIRTIKCNEKWIIIAFTKSDGTSIIFRVYDSQNLQQVFECQEDLDPLPQKYRSNDEVLTQSVWLCGNFFVFWDSDELKIWNIPLKKLIDRKVLSSLPLKEFLKKKVPHTSIQKEPIIYVDIQQTAINVLLENDETISIQRVKFGTDDELIQSFEN